MWQQFNLGELIGFFFIKAEWNCGLRGIYSEQFTDENNLNPFFLFSDKHY